jgi:hypothetical protein
MHVFSPPEIVMLLATDEWISLNAFLPDVDARFITSFLNIRRRMRRSRDSLTACAPLRGVHCAEGIR